MDGNTTRYCIHRGNHLFPLILLFANSIEGPVCTSNPFERFVQGQQTDPVRFIS